MSTELDNHNNLETGQEITQETNNDSININESQTDMSLNQDENKSELQDSVSLNDDGINNSSTVIDEELAEHSQVEETESLDQEQDLGSETVTETDMSLLALRAEIEGLKTQLEAQKAETQNVQGQFMRLTADFDNYRRRTAKEKEDLEQQIKRKTLSELLSVVDNFERARTQIKPADDGEMNIHKSYQGVYKTLVDSFKRLGVSAMRPEGNPFDPNYHEAMMREPTDEYEEGIVIEQLVRGYLLHDQVLRHAMVKVATAKDENDQNNNSDETTGETESENIN